MSHKSFKMFKELDPDEFSSGSQCHIVMSVALNLPKSSDSTTQKRWPTII